MFGNCPWNLNSSILVNSVAERHAQKRKIRNGQLPMPKLIKTPRSSDASCLTKTASSESPSTSDSLLPDTVLLSDDIVRKADALEISSALPHGTSALARGENSSLLNEISTSADNLRRTMGLSPDHAASVSTSKLINGVHLRGFIDVNDRSLLSKVCLEASDGCVLKLGCSGGRPRVLTVVQENKITFWEYLLPISLDQFGWSIKASISVAMNISNCEQLADNCSHELLFEMGLCPSSWISVVLIFHCHESKVSLYSCDALGATKEVENIPWSRMEFEKHKNLKSCILNSSALILWSHIDGKGTVLKKCVLSEAVDALSEENELVGTKSYILSIHRLNETKSVVIGISKEHQLILWNHVSGNVIKSIDLFSCEISSCVGTLEDKGILFLLANGKPGSAHLVAINLSTNKWMLLKTYASDKLESITGYSIDGDLLLAAYEDNIKIWDMEAAIALSCFLPQKKSITYVFSKDIVFMTDDYSLYIIDNSIIFQLQRTDQSNQ